MAVAGAAYVSAARADRSSYCVRFDPGHEPTQPQVIAIQRHSLDLTEDLRLIHG